jgi:hypothetical protein
LDPKAQPSPPALKAALLGCAGLLTLALLGVGACTVALYFANRRASGIATVGAEHLKSEPRIVRVLGTIHKVDRKVLGTKVSIVNGQGVAYFAYTMLGTQGNGDAEVWLNRAPGRPWEVTGAVVQPGPLNAKAPASLMRLGSPGISPFDSVRLRN